MLKSASQRRGQLVFAVAGAAFVLVRGENAHAQNNLLLDPSFEAGIAGAPAVTFSGGGENDPSMVPPPATTGNPWIGWNNWVPAPYAAQYNAQVARTGTQCGKTYSGPNAGIFQYAPVTGGESYTASAWFYDLSTDALNSGETIDVRMTFFSGPNGTGNNLGLVISPLTLTPASQQNTWTQLSASAGAPAAAQSVQWLAFFNNQKSAGGAMYVDDASLLDTSWNGGGTSNNWSEAANWGGVTPTQYAPLVFSGTTKTTSSNDLPAGTPFYGISFTPTAGAFVLNGNGVNLAFDVVNNSTNLQTIAVNIGMQQNTNFNTAAGDVKVSGNIGGAFSVIKQGTHTLTLSGSNAYTGQTVVNAGTLVLGSAGALPAGDDLTIAASSTVVASNLGPAVGFQVGALSNSGKLDLNNNALVVHSSDLPTVNGLVQAGYNNGGWNGASGIVSTSASTNPKHLTALGVIANDNGSGGPLYGTGGSIAPTLDGANAAFGDVLVKYTYYGDTNLDGKVDGTDYTRVDAGFMADKSTPGSVTGWYNGDFNYDGTVNGSDYTLIDNAFNQQGAQLAALVAQPTAQIAGTAAVPEPTALGLLSAGMAGVLGRRRRIR